MKFKLKICLTFIVLSLISGCSTYYTYEGEKYKSKEKFHQAVDSTINRALTKVEPLSSPLTGKKLVFAMPSQSAFINASNDRFVSSQGSQPTGSAKEILENLSRANYRNIKVFYDAVLKKNIYSSVQFVDLSTMNSNYPASPNIDVIYFVEPMTGSAQWFYLTEKNGKQIFAYDRSSPTPEGKINAFVDAVQLLAIKD
jgi:hypothetical protein